MSTTMKNSELDWELVKFYSKKYLKFPVTTFLMMMFLFTGFTSFSQDEDEEMDSTRQGKVQQLKIAYITKELNLTAAEAEKFWPIYNEMDAKIVANRKEKRKLVKEMKENQETLKDEDFKKKINALLDYEAKETTIKKEYIEKIAVIIGYKKSAKLINLEQQFKRELLKRLNETKNPGNGPKPGGAQKPVKRE